MKTQTLILALAAVVFTTGCTSMKSRFDKLPKMASLTESASSSTDSPSNQRGDLPEFKTPQRMLAIWKDSVRTEAGKPPMRGFGGRIYLYGANGEPVRAQGDLVVYGFDDSVKNREGSKADQKIVIENSKLQSRYGETALGPSYSVWIDWDEVGSPDKSVTLVPFLRTPEGEIIKAGQTIYTLHSPKKQDAIHKEKLVSHEEETQGKESSVSHANYLQADGEKNGVVQASGVQKLSRPRSSVRTTTISIPKETQQRLRESSFGLKTFGSQANSSKNVEVETATRSGLPSRLEEARKKRLEEIKNGNVFGMPGQL